MAENNSHSVELPQWLNVIIYLLLLTILAVCADLFTFILGAIGVTIAFVAYFNSKKSADGHH